MKRRLITALLLAAAVSCFSLGVGAWGYFSGEGSGSGSGSSGTTVPVTLAPAIADAGLYPGGSADVVLTASNAKTAEVRLISLALDTTRATDGFAVDSGHHGCGLAALSFTTQTHGGAGWTVPAGGTLAITLPGAVAMSVTAADACQGATFTVYVTAGT